MPLFAENAMAERKTIRIEVILLGVKN